MRFGMRRIMAALAGVALAAGMLAGTASGESRNRSLERVIAKGMFSPDEGTRIQRAFAAAVQAGVREREVLSLVEACVSSEFEAPQVLRMLSVAAQLALEDLPVEGFISKIEEGGGKRASPERVVLAAERRALTLNKAKLIINGLVLQGLEIGDRDGLLTDLAAALEAGRAPGEAEAILAEALKAGERSGAIRRKLFP